LTTAQSFRRDVPYLFSMNFSAKSPQNGRIFWFGQPTILGGFSTVWLKLNKTNNSNY
jgi:hypothetical protein